MRYLSRLRPMRNEAETLRIERMLATARVLLAVLALFAIWLDPTEPTRYATLAYILLIAYMVYSFGIWGVLQRITRTGRVPLLLLLLMDLVFPTVFMLFTEGPNSPLFMFFVFVMTSAAIRWGFSASLGTALLATALVGLEAVIVNVAPAAWRLGVESHLEVNRYVIRTSYLLIIGLLIGYMAEQDKEVRAENDFLRRLLEKARPDAGVRAAMYGLMAEIVQLFPCAEARMVLQNTHTLNTFEWTLRPGEKAVGLRELDGAQREAEMFPMPAEAFHLEQRRRGPALWMIDRDGRRQRAASGWQPPAPLPDRLTCVSFAWGGEWRGRLVLHGARLGWDRLRELRFAQRIERQIGPAMYSVYLMRRLRTRAGAIERARVARELHDGAIQTMVGVEMQVEVLRRKVAGNGADAALSSELERIRDLLRNQTFDLRALMQQMKPLDLTPKQLLDFLADAVERFRRDSGIQATFVSELEEVDLPPRLCRELARIAQEALINARKHSGASKVLVRFASSEGKCRLIIDDNGKGFDFMGRVTLDYLDATRRGPQVIKERARAIGAELIIESLPGQGARLEIIVPHVRALAAYV
ncbi:MAG TPA: histidine kinase [Terriglobales bacterium]|nr:histidine kinase [Terriglobales bacterium]